MHMCVYGNFHALAVNLFICMLLLLSIQDLEIHKYFSSLSIIGSKNQPLCYFVCVSKNDFQYFSSGKPCKCQGFYLFILILALCIYSLPVLTHYIYQTRVDIHIQSPFTSFYLPQTRLTSSMVLIQVTFELAYKCLFQDSYNIQN